MTGKAYAFKKGGVDAFTGAPAADNNQGQIADFDTPADVDAKIAAAIAAFAATLASSSMRFWGQIANLASGTTTRYLYLSTGTVSTPVLAWPLAACKASRLYVDMMVNGATTDQVYTVLKNGIDTALVVTVAAGITGISHFDSDVIFSEGDTVSLRHVNTNGGTGLTSVSASIVFSPTKT